VTEARIFAAPPRYIQGPGSLDLIGCELRALGRRPAVICDAALLPALEERLRRSLDESGLPETILPFAGDVTLRSIEKVADEARGFAADVIAGVGGGRVLDAAKGAALRLGAPFVSAATIAATDAAASRGIVVHDETGAVTGVEQLQRSPACVLVDTALIAAAPSRYLRAGIGDALSKRVELDTCRRQGVRSKQGTRALLSAFAMADECHRLIRRHGAAAFAAVERHEVTEDVEAVVEAVLLQSCMAFENGGLSVTHAVAHALAGEPAARDALHGEHVAYATLVEMALEGWPEAEIRELAGFLRSLRLPTSLAELGLPAPGEAALRALADASCGFPHLAARRRPVDPASLVAAIRLTERHAQQIDLSERSPV
jgi:glycerol dehydrogenase